MTNTLSALALTVSFFTMAPAVFAQSPSSDSVSCMTCQTVEDHGVISLTGHVTAVDASTITVQANDEMEVTVHTDDATKFLRRLGDDSSMSEVAVGDAVSVKGQWTDDTRTAIDAETVWDKSIQNGGFKGSVVSVDENGLTIQSQSHGQLIVYVTEDTALTDRAGNTMLLTDVHVDDVVIARGLWNRTLMTLTAGVLRDLSAHP